MKSGWRKVSVGEILKLEYGKPLPPDRRKADGLYPAYGANGEIARTDEFYYDKPSIIVGRKGSAGELNLTEDRFWALDVTYFVTHDCASTDLRFLYYLLTNLDLPSMAKGVKPGINRNEVYGKEIFIPPLADQKRIVAILDQALGAADRAAGTVERNVVNARQLFYSFLNEVFGKRHAELPRVQIYTVCESVVDCVNKTAPKVKGPTPYMMIRTTNVREGRVSLETVNYVTRDVYETWTRRQVPKRGDVLLTREAPLGEVGMLLSDDSVFLGQRLVSYRADEEKLDNRYLLFALQSSDVQRQIASMASGATVQHMRVPDCSKLTLPLPTLSEQRVAVENLIQAKDASDRASSIYARKRDAINGLRQTIIRDAFQGRI